MRDECAEDEPVSVEGALPSDGLRTVAWTLAAIPVAATVARFGELSIEAFVAVMVAGVAVMSVGLWRRSGSAAQFVGPGGFLWLGWVTAVSAWELAMFLDDTRFPTLSDLMDPVLAHPVVRGTATVAWFAAGVWLVRRPRRVSSGEPPLDGRWSR